MCKKILVIDDEEQIGDMIKNYLELYKYKVIKTTSYFEAEKKLGEDIDLILLDIMMPKVDGFKVCRKIREQIQCPIVFLSAKDMEDDKIQALSLGGDDYITKPFSLKELKARIESHIRREERIKTKNRKCFTCGKIRIDLECKEVFCNGHKLCLTKKEYELIEILILNKGKVFSKVDIFEKVWGYNCESDIETVTEHIKKVRNKIRQYDDENSYIDTIWGMGYKWEKKNV
ncbi:response regulator transcription factor [Clostridium sp. JS66]|uniref:response regulator transcription factor n=1 Tax=Clostridium sp. JS66 TaxID=3064705 RepID=UPI00298DCB36|nr:response regulator transcription factor [Clostridium sp. JS66]WPC43333.1 response regulator transcription factor [Clostridium sp. JS66]